MTDRLIVDLGEGGRVSVATMLDGELFSAGDPAALPWPLDNDALEDLRWYLEDYLTAPFGVWEDRGQRVEAGLRGWGRDIFESVFGAGPARDAYTGIRARGDMEVVFRSSSPSLLGLPWELMADQGGLPLALEVGGVSRSLPIVADAAQTVPVPGGRLRVLMVISRPAGTGDVDYRIVARPLLARLEAVRGSVDLVVLRPPTRHALRAELAAAAAAGTPFQVVHFDGHGTFLGSRGGDGGEGVLVFEKSGGGADHVPAAVIAQVLKDGQVPVVVLNACQSGAVGKELEAAVATRLLRDGIASVVAMAYSVYAAAAAEFMAAFYERLFAGGTVSSAVTAGRRQLYRKPERPSPKGGLPLADWLVPVHYFRRDVSFPQAVTPRSAGLLPLTEALEAVSAAAEEMGTSDLDAGDGVFVGRDSLFYQLEATACLQKVVVLTGPGGTGKTELAKAFGRWWRDTGGVDDPGWVFWHSFEPGVASFGLDGVITKIGQRLNGTDFALLDTAQRRVVVEKALMEHRMLLIWDNFESVRSMPDPGRATPPLDEPGCAELREFLERMAGHGKTSVLITSRTVEDWLGDVRRIPVGGLPGHEAVEYADVVLAPYPSARERRTSRAFGELMEWLDGHPLSIRLTLPRLAATAPDALLAALRGNVPLAGEGRSEAGRTGSLAASVAYSYVHLAERTRRLLPAVSLFHLVADAVVLDVFSQSPGVPGRFAGATVVDWEAALDDAARVGLLTSIGDRMYRIHPALPGYLATVWRDEEPGGHAAVRDAGTRALLSAHAALGGFLLGEIESGDARRAYVVIGLQGRTLGSLLGYALDRRLWEEAQSIIAPLNAYWKARGLAAEADAWADRARLATEAPDGTPPGLDTTAGALWLLAIRSKATREVERGHLEEAEGAYLGVLPAIQSIDPSPEQQHRLAVTYYYMGVVAEERDLLGDAGGWYRKSLIIMEKLGDRRGMAANCQQLGAVEQRGRRLGDAAEWYRKSLAIKKQLNDRPGMFGAYFQLGVVAQEQDLLGDAAEWYRKSLAIAQELNDQRGMADAYHQLGNLCYLRNRLKEAEQWYRKSLVIRESLRNRPGMAFAYGQLGLLAEKREHWTEALAWMVRCVALFSEFPHPATGPGPENLAQLAGLLGTGALEDCWRQVTGQALPDKVRAYVDAYTRQRGDT